MPWALDFGWALAFIGVGSAVSVAVRPRRWAAVLEPWAASATALFALGALALASSPRLRLLAVMRNSRVPAALSGLYQPEADVMDWRQVVLFLAAAIASALVLFALRRRNRMR
jgi:hypothetical protein